MTAEQVFFNLCEQYTGTGIPPSKLISNSMIEYARIKCEEQRELCRKAALESNRTTNAYDINIAIKNAPAAELK